MGGGQVTIMKPVEPLATSADLPREGYRPSPATAVSLLGLIVVWFLLTHLGLVSEVALPKPQRVAETFADLLVEPFGGTTLIGHALASLGRWAVGLTAAVLVGIPLGVFMAWMPAVNAAVTPVFEVLRYIPPIAWIPVAVLWFGAGLTAQSLVVFVAAFPALVINSHLAVSRVDPVLLRAGQVLGSGQLRLLVSVALPVATPTIVAGFRIAISNAWMAIVGAELIVGTAGLGFLISQGQANSNISIVISGMMAIGLIGAILDFVTTKLSARVMRWRPSSGAGR